LVLDRNGKWHMACKVLQNSQQELAKPVIMYRNVYWLNRKRKYFRRPDDIFTVSKFSIHRQHREIHHEEAHSVSVCAHKLMVHGNTTEPEVIRGIRVNWFFVHSLCANFLSTFHRLKKLTFWFFLVHVLIINSAFTPFHFSVTVSLLQLQRHWRTALQKQHQQRAIITVYYTIQYQKNLKHVDPFKNCVRQQAAL